MKESFAPVRVWRNGDRRRARPSPQELAKRYNRAAAHWQHRYVERWGFPRAYASFCRRMVAQDLLPDGAAHILDCGIGTAAFTIALTKSRAVEHVYGVDASPRMLAQAQRRLTEYHVDATLQCADVHDLPFPDGYFDLVLSSHMLEHLPAPWLGMRELARVLRPRGTLAIIVTRANPVDLPARLLWRYAPISGSALATWLTEAGLAPPRHHPLGSSARAPFWLSRAVTSRKI